ncbi:MAG: type II toxin-antitoxin system HicB family antitoxin [Pseudomonadota bacterium]
MRNFKIVVERHLDGFVAYPVGLAGIVVGEGDTLSAAVCEVGRAIQVHLKTLGSEDLEQPIDAMIVDLSVPA